METQSGAEHLPSATHIWRKETPLGSVCPAQSHVADSGEEGGPGPHCQITLRFREAMGATQSQSLTTRPAEERRHRSYHGNKNLPPAFVCSVPGPGTFCPGSLWLLSAALGSRPKHLITMASPGHVQKMGRTHPASSKNFSPTNTMLVVPLSPRVSAPLTAPLTAPSPAWQRPPWGLVACLQSSAGPNATGSLHTVTCVAVTWQVPC